MSLHQFKTMNKISLKSRTEVTEDLIHQRIKDDPTILGLGELIVRDIERRQPGAGRIDLLLEEIETNRRYEVEVQLGKTDESHIIRTIEYWDIERKRYPQYDHCAVLIAEDVTSRFLNVVQLLNGNIPIMAIQLDAFQLEDNTIGLSFTKIIDELEFGYIDDDQEPLETVDKQYWEERATPDTVKWTDRILKILKEIDKTLDFKYNKYYIGVARKGRVNNFVRLKPRKKHIGTLIKLEKTDEVDEKIEKAEIDSLDYDRKRGTYRLQLVEEDMTNNIDLLKEILEMSYNSWNF